MMVFGRIDREDNSQRCLLRGRGVAGDGMAAAALLVDSSMAFFMALLSSSLVCLVYMLLGQKAAFKNANSAHFRPHLFSTTISS